MNEEYVDYPEEDGIMDSDAEEDTAMQRRPSRSVKLLMPAVSVGDLPDQWTPAGGRKGWKIDIMGKDLGGYGHRRIVIRALTIPNHGDIVKVRVMQTTQYFDEFDEETTVSYKYMALDPVGKTGARTNLPVLQWTVFECDAALRAQGRLVWENHAYWYQTIDSTEGKTYRLGVLSITDENNHFEVIDRKTQQNLLCI